MSDSANPYAAPSELPSESYEPVPDEVVPAGRGARFVNFIIDYFAQLGIGLGVGIFIGLVFGEAGIDALENVPGIVINAPILLVYYFVCEATASRTIGKLVTGTKVVDEYGGKPTMGQIAGRTFSRLIPFEVFSFFGTPTRGWHDRIPGTFVVKCR